MEQEQNTQNPAAENAVEENTAEDKKIDISNVIPTAPYNFVPLNNVVVAPPLAKYIADENDAENLQKGYKAFMLNGKKYSGYFDVNIENITPFYIAGENGFFPNGENIRIPGSSLRGCIKNIFKIVTNSGVNTVQKNELEYDADEKQSSDPDIDDKQLYFRTMASKYEPLRTEYNREMVTEVDENSETDGQDADSSSELVLNKEKLQEMQDKIQNNSIQKQNNDKKKKKTVSQALAGFIVRKYHESSYYIVPAKLKPKKLESYGDRGPRIEWSQDNTSADIYTGPMMGKKHYYWIHDAKWGRELEIPPKVVDSYRNDKYRNKDRDADKVIDLLDEEANSANRYVRYNDKYEYIIPCFYKAEGSRVAHFGAGPYYRIPYKKTIGEHVPDEIKNPAVDFTSAVFGNKEHWASRVFFEDSFLAEGQKAEFYDEAFAKALLEPKPTSFQFYLNTENGKPAHWNQNTNIRGYKFYWHRKTDWADRSVYTEDNIHNRMSPLKEGHKFSGRIRFKNLDSVELGALADVLSICDTKDTCFKLGMGKPIGMGSVKVTAKLNLQGDDYYKTLFDDSGFAKAKAADAQQFIQAFKSYIDSRLSANKEYKQNYQARIKAMMDIFSTKYMKDSDWNEQQTRYCDINNEVDAELLKVHKPLPTIEDVIDQIK